MIDKTVVDYSNCIIQDSSGQKTIDGYYKLSINFECEIKEGIKKIIEDFNSGRFGHRNVTTKELYHNYLWLDRNNKYSLDSLGYELVMLSLINQNAEDFFVMEYSNDFVRFMFKDKETEIISEHIMEHDPEQGLLILRTSNKDRRFSFEFRIINNKPTLIFWRD